ncbi:Bug family tripartite tricarboxylate transporter substrate binding protein [Xanthobacter tagetidis]|nr:tripartite tricarboxylate transporter substrate binding protein [Xanthobacter tagetidis]MBB6309789.1 tripartite-type tricarboxylate transporter receptor subunit TctC [Xanthobacter tagetidis]
MSKNLIDAERFAQAGSPAAFNGVGRLRLVRVAGLPCHGAGPYAWTSRDNPAGPAITTKANEEETMDGNLSRRSILKAALTTGAAGAAGLLSGTAAFAQGADGWPNRPITIIVPVAAGGIIDLLSRAVGDVLSPVLKTPIVTEPRPGADHMIGTRFVARAEPDGYTWLFASVPFTVSPALSRNPGFDPVADFAPLQMIASSPNVLVVPASVPAKTVKEFVALVKSKPGEFNYANPGNGSSNHLGMEMLKQVAGLDIMGIVYKGQPPAIVDLLAGRVQAMMISSSLVGQYVANGTLRALAVVAPSRLTALPDVPTIAEAGYPDVNVVPWFGLFAPAKTPAPILAKARGALHDALAGQDLQGKIRNIGAVPYPPNGPEAFASHIKNEIAQWPALVAKAGLEKN